MYLSCLCRSCVCVEMLLPERALNRKDGGRCWIARPHSQLYTFHRMWKQIIKYNNYTSKTTNIQSLFAPLVLVLTVGIFTWLPFWFLVICECLLSKSVIPAHKVVGKLPLILSCAYRKFDNLILSPNFNISHLLYKEFTEYLKGLKSWLFSMLYFVIFPFLRLIDWLLCPQIWEPYRSRDEKIPW